MKKRLSKVLLMCGVTVVLTACGQESAATGNLAQDINIGAGASGNAYQGSDSMDQGAETADQENSREGKGVFSFMYEGIRLVPGEVVDHSALPECTDVAEVPSCAFGGNDKVYNYKMFELTAYLDGDEERVYSIYFMDPNLSTPEGLCLGDSVDDMKALYGEDYETEGTACIYTRGETMLTVIVRNDVVVSIEYRLDR